MNLFLRVRQARQLACSPKVSKREQSLQIGQPQPAILPYLMHHGTSARFGKGIADKRDDTPMFAGQPSRDADEGCQPLGKIFIPLLPMHQKTHFINLVLLAFQFDGCHGSLLACRLG